MTEINYAKLLQQAPRRLPSSTFWLVVRLEDRQMEVLMMACSGEQALPIFSGEHEAEMFVWLEGTFEDYWRVRETSAGKLVSNLYGPCAGVGRVALDLSPEMVGIGSVSLVSVTRKRFLSSILDSPCSISLGAHDTRVAGEVEGVRLIDPTPMVCLEGTVLAVIGYVLVYRNGAHLTATYVRTFAPWLGKQLPEPAP